MYRIAKGTPGLLRALGGKWKPYKAAMDSTFATAAPHRGVHLIFERRGWQFMVLRKHVRGPNGQDRSGSKYPRRGTFNRCILGRNGKGASRRRAMRRKC